MYEVMKEIENVDYESVNVFSYSFARTSAHGFMFVCMCAAVHFAPHSFVHFKGLHKALTMHTGMSLVQSLSTVLRISPFL